MSSKQEKDIVSTVEQDETYVKALKELSEEQRKDVEATVASFARILGPMVENLEKLESSDELVKAVQQRLAEKLRDR
jgi:hypothetical protein